MPNYQQPEGTYTLKQAAELLEVPHRKLIERLKEEGYISEQRLPYLEHVHKGFFVITTGSYRLKGSESKKQYPVTLVTELGLSLILSIVTRKQIPMATKLPSATSKKQHNTEVGKRWLKKLKETIPVMDNKKNLKKVMTA